MMLNIQNHNLKFTYKKRIWGPGYNVNVRDTESGTITSIGHIEKVPGGWIGFNTNNAEVTYRKGKRDFTSEFLAFHAGILDGNYNRI